MQITLIFTAGILLLADMIPFARHMMYFMSNKPQQSTLQLWTLQRTEKDEAWLNALEVNISLQVHIIITTH